MEETDNQDLYLNYKGIRFLLDTGAQVTTINRLPPGAQKLEGKYRVYGFSKEMEPVYRDKYLWEGLHCIVDSCNLMSLKDAVLIKQMTDKVPEETKNVNWLRKVDLGKEIDRVVKETLLPKEELREFLENYKEKCAKSKNDCGKLAEKYEYTIMGGIPTPQRQYPLNKAAYAEIRETINELCKKGVISVQENCPTNSPIQAVEKPDKTWRLVTNFKALNKVTVPDTRYLINARDATNSMNNGKILSKIDLANGFWSVPLAKESRARTAFTFEGKQYVYNRLPQGFCNSPNVFQAIILEVLEGLPVTAYIDDVLISTETVEEHMNVLKETIKRLTEAGFLLNLKKLELGKERVNFLGFEVSGTDRGIAQTTHEKLEELKQTPIKNLKQLQSLLGRLNFVRDLIPGFSAKAKTLYKATAGDNFKWDEKLEKIKCDLIDMALGSGRIVRRDPDKNLIVKIDNTPEEMEVILYNEGNVKSPVMFISHEKPANHKKHENMSSVDILATTARNLLTIKSLAAEKLIVVMAKGEGIDLLAREAKNLVNEQKMIHVFTWAKWKKLIFDKQIEFRNEKTAKKERKTIINPNQLCYFTDGSSEKGQVWWGFLVKLDGKTIHREKGRLEDDKSAQEAEVTAVDRAIAHMKNNNQQDCILVTDSEYVYLGIVENLSTWEQNDFHNAKGKPLAQRELWINISKNYKMVNPRVLHQTSHTVQKTEAAKGNKEVDEYIRVRAVTKQSEGSLLQDLHNKLKHPSTTYLARYCHHMGLNVPNLKTKYQKIKLNCPDCRKVMTSVYHDFGKIKTDKENVEISLDFAGPLRPKTKKNNVYFLVIVDNCTNFTQIYPCSQATSKAVVDSLKEWIKYRGPPERVRGDNAHNLTGLEVKNFCKEQGITLVKAVKYQPSSNGIAENYVKRCKNWFIKNQKPNIDWDELIEECIHFLNYRVPKVNQITEPTDTSRNPFKVGDKVYILFKQKQGRFRSKTGTEDKV
ncbi:MAG: reverse transcriptase domain-containing protein, partial [Vagococcus fluvialis]